MKKTLKLALCGLMLAGATNAQVVTLPEGNYDFGYGILPKTFSSDGKTKFIAPEELGEDGNTKIHIYNSSFNVEHCFEVIPQKITSKTVTEMRAYEPVYGESLNGDLATRLGVEGMLIWWNSASVDEKMSFAWDNIHTFWYWDINDYYEDSVYIDSKGDVYTYYIYDYYDHESRQELTLITGYMVLSGTTVKYQPINYLRTGEWEVVDTEEYEYENDMTAIFEVFNFDSDWSYELSSPLVATQTLFNTDAKYEYIRYKQVAYSNHVGEGWDTDGDAIPDKRNIRSGYECVGIEVVSEDDNVIASFDVGGDVEDVDLILWEGKRYFMLDVYNDGNYECQIYEINPNGSGITRASSAAFMHILPAMPKKNTNVTVELGEESVKNGGQLMITDMSGRTVYCNAVAPGETSVQVPLRRMASGVYSVTLMNRGQKIENSKLIIR